MEARPMFLGIDLGTTAVKIALVDGQNRLVHESERKHGANCAPVGQPFRNEQCPRQSVRTLHTLLAAVDRRTKGAIRAVAISGQMHGVVAWNAKSLSSLDECNCSNLITWMDARCDRQFLDALPKWVDAEDGCEKAIASGYGMATLAWLKASGQLDAEWDCAGTLMDFLVAHLSQSSKVRMSAQNAASWGYASALQWTVEGRAELFPVHLFPQIVPVGTCVAHTRIPFADLPLDIPILAALGDLQASLLPVLQSGEAALHVGTSAQIALIGPAQQESAIFAPNSFCTVAARPLPPSVAKLPYFGGRCLLVAASLNGGNTLECFAQQIASWSRSLCANCESPPANSCSSLPLDRILDSPSQTGSLEVRPLFFGERHNPLQTATVRGWRADTTLEEFLCAIARGLIANLAQMMPAAVLASQRIGRLRLVGRANQRVFREEAARQFPSLDILAADQTQMSAAFGAATHARSCFARWAGSENRSPNARKLHFLFRKFV